MASLEGAEQNRHATRHQNLWCCQRMLTRLATSLICGALISTSAVYAHAEDVEESAVSASPTIVSPTAEESESPSAVETESVQPDVQPDTEPEQTSTPSLPAEEVQPTPSEKLDEMMSRSPSPSDSVTSEESDQPRSRSRRSVESAESLRVQPGAYGYREPTTSWMGNMRLPGTDDEKDLTKWISQSNAVRKNIKAEKGKFTTPERTYRKEENNVGLSITAEYSSDGNYIIWKFKTWHRFGNGNQNFYLRFTPGEGLERKPERNNVTVSPLHYMEHIYNSSEFRGGYENGEVKSASGSYLGGQRYENTVYLWRKFQERDATPPVPKDEQVEFQVITKITDHERKDYSMDATLNVSWHGAGGFSWTKTPVTGFIEGKTNQIVIQKQVDQDIVFRIFNQFGQQAGRGLYNLQGRQGMYTIGKLPKFDPQGVRQKYRLQVDSAPADVQLIALNQDGDEWTARRNNNRVSDFKGGAALASDPYGEADTLYGRARHSTNDATLKGQYTKDGKYIIWTATYLKKDGGANDDLYVYPQFGPGLRLAHTTPMVDFQSGYNAGNEYRKYLKIGNPATDEQVWNDNGYWGYQRVNNNAEYRLTWVTEITDPNRSEYKARFHSHYNWYSGSKKLLDYVEASVEGLKFSPHVRSVKVFPNSYQRELEGRGYDDMPKIPVTVLNADTKEEVAKLTWDATTRSYKSNTLLPRFDTSGNKILYSLKVDTDPVRVAFNPALVKFSANILPLDDFGGKWDVNFLENQAELDQKYGVTNVEQLAFRYYSSKTLKEIEPRMPSNFDGHYAWMEGAFAIPDDAKQGDYFTLKIPPIGNIKAPYDFDIYTRDERGVKQVIAKADIDENTNVVKFYLTDYVDTHDHIRGRFSIGPIITSIFDAYKNETGRTIDFKTEYYRAGETSPSYVNTLQSSYAVKYSDDFLKNSVYNTVKKEEYGETDHTITYGLHINRTGKGPNIYNSYYDQLGDEKSESYSWAKWTTLTGPAVNTTDPKEFVRIYRVPPMREGEDAVAVSRDDVREENLIYPINGGAKPGWTVDIKVNGRKLTYTIQNREGGSLQPAGPLLMLVNVKKIDFRTDTPQQNTAGSVGQTYSSATRYPTYGVGEAYGVRSGDNTSRIRIRKSSILDRNTLLKGAEFSLYRQGGYDSGNPSNGLLGQGVTNDNGELTFSGVFERGFYDLVETRSPEGYTSAGQAAGRDNPILRTIWVNGDSSLNTYDVVNNPINQITLIKGHFAKDGENIRPDQLPSIAGVDTLYPREILLRGVDNDQLWLDHYTKGKFTPLAKAGYRLYYVNPDTGQGERVGRAAITNERGIATWTNITRPGTYYAEEVVAPKGYNMPPAIIGETDDDKTRPQSGVWQSRKVYFTLKEVPGEGGVVAAIEYAHNDDDNQEPFLLSLGDRVWYDLDKNGVQNVEENNRNVAGVTVELYPGDVDTSNPGQPLKTAKTNDDGYYEFKGLHEGKYRLRFVLPEDIKNRYEFTQKKAESGAREADDSDVDADGWTDVVNLKRGQKNRPQKDLDNPNVDAGLIPATPKKQRIGITKLADDSASRLQGVRFDLYDDPAGDPIADGIVDAPADKSMGDVQFITAELDVNRTYWLREVKAPEGYQLLPVAIPFMVNEDGLITLIEPQTASSLVSVGNRVLGDTTLANNALTVNNVPIGHLPAAGGRTPFIPVAVGIVMILLALRTGYRTAKERGLIA